ncbi:MAG: LysR family transcriptional regulator [Burkholderiaceae bacterium]
MELRHLRYFLAVADERNFTRAAARLGIGQPPLSQQIRDLEQELGARLFERTPQGANLTAAGSALLAEARALVDGAQQARQAVERAVRGQSGRLRVGFTASATFNPVVPGAIRGFRRAYAEVQLVLQEANTMQLIEGLAQSRFDAIFLRPGVSDPEGVRLHRFADEPLKIALPASHRLAGAGRLPLSALARDPFVLFPRAVGVSLHDEILNACRQAGFEPQLNQEAPQIATLVNLVAAELGVALVPAAIARIALDGVRYLDIEPPVPVARLALATRLADDGVLVANFIAECVALG